MRRLKVTDMGEDVQGVTLNGDRRDPEPIHFRVVLPFGDVDVVRTTDDEYWIHVRVNRPTDRHHVEGRSVGRITDARVDATDRHGGELDPGVLADPALHHLAVRVGPEPVASRPVGRAPCSCTSGDAAGREIGIGTYVSQPVYPRGTIRGWVVAGDRAICTACDGFALLVVTEHGSRRYPLSGRARVMLQQLRPPAKLGL